MKKITKLSLVDSCLFGVHDCVQLLRSTKASWLAVVEIQKHMPLSDQQYSQLQMLFSLRLLTQCMPAAEKQPIG